MLDARPRSPQFFYLPRLFQLHKVSAGYLCDNILRTHPGDHFGEGHRSRSAAVNLFSFADEAGLQTSQALQVKTRTSELSLSSQVWLRCQSRHGHLSCRQPCIKTISRPSKFQAQQKQEDLAHPTKMPTSRVQESRRKLFGWRCLGHRICRSFGQHWLDLITLQCLMHCRHLLLVDVQV